MQLFKSFFPGGLEAGGSVDPLTPEAISPPYV